MPELKLSASELKISITRTQDLGNRAYDLSTTTKHLKALEIRVSVPELEANCRTKLLQQEMGDWLNWGTPVQSIAARPFPAWTPPSVLNPFNPLHLGSTPFNEGSARAAILNPSVLIRQWILLFLQDSGPRCCLRTKEVSKPKCIAQCQDALEIRSRSVSLSLPDDV